MDEIKQFLEDGKYVLGVCNGFQILCESRLLPGALLHNTNHKFICKNVHLKTITTQTVVTNQFSNKPIQIPIAHGEGRYYADDETLKELINNDQILFKYCNEDGEVLTKSNPNGSNLNIAGICNKNRNVFGMMPHPERMVDKLISNTDGVNLFSSILH